MLKTDSADKISLGTPFGAFLEKFSKIMDFDHLSLVLARDKEGCAPRGSKMEIFKFL